jgi:integrase/recombinase XerD
MFRRGREEKEMGYTLSAHLADLYDEFLALERPRVSAQGYTAIAGLSRRMLAWFDAEELDVYECSIQDAVRYEAWLSEHRSCDDAPLATGTMHNYLKAARRFFDFLVVTGRRASNPFRELRFPRLGEHVSRNVLSEAQMGRLLRELSQWDALLGLARLRRYRVHVLAEFLYATGLRIAEACSLTEANIDLAHRIVYVPEGKGGKARAAFLTGYTVAVLETYLAHGRALVLGNYPRAHAETLFGANKARVAAVMNGELAKVCTALGIPVITSHGFRHSLGTHLLRAGCDMRHIQVILGHERLQTTQVYTRVDKDDLRRSLDAFHPRQWHPHCVEAGEPCRANP